jgi:maleate isomerase
MTSPPLRIGMIVPSSNTAFEPAVAEMQLPKSDVTLHASRARVTSVSLGSDSQAQFGSAPLCAAALLLADARPDLLVWAGTSGLWLGLDHDRALCEALREATSVPATTTALALFDACATLGVRRCALVTPYLSEVVDRIVATCAEAGVAVVAERHLGLSDNHAFGLVTEQEISALALACTSDDLDGCLIACTNLGGAGIVAALEQQMRAPVLDSIAVTIWHALKVAGLARPGTPQRPGPGTPRRAPAQIGAL